jgi:hypothetical protein
MAKSVRLSKLNAAIVNNALNYLLNGVPYSTTGMGVSPTEAERVRQYFHNFPGGSQPVDPDMARIGAEALRRVLDLLAGDPEMSILIADEADATALATQLERAATS